MSLFLFFPIVAGSGLSIPLQKPRHCSDGQIDDGPSSQPKKVDLLRMSIFFFEVSMVDTGPAWMLVALS